MGVKIIGLLISIAFLGGFALGNIIPDKEQSPLAAFANIIEYKEQDIEMTFSDPIPASRDSPKGRVGENEIHVYSRRVIVDVEDAILARFTDTKSMEPVLNRDTNAIEIKPRDEGDIQVGDIISYTSAFSDAIIIHRVVEKG